MSINEVLKERASRYGEFKDVATYSQHLKELWYDSIKEDDIISEPMQEAMEMILHKIARIFSGDKNYKDNFIDLIGYAELYLKEVERVEDIKNKVEDEELMKLVTEIFKEFKEKEVKKDTEPKEQCNNDAIDILRNVYGLDI